MTNLHSKIEGAIPLLLFVAKEYFGFTTESEIRANLPVIDEIAIEVMKQSKDRILTKFNTSEWVTDGLAIHYKARVMNAPENIEPIGYSYFIQDNF